MERNSDQNTVIMMSPGNPAVCCVNYLQLTSDIKPTFCVCKIIISFVTLCGMLFAALGKAFNSVSTLRNNSVANHVWCYAHQENTTEGGCTFIIPNRNV